MKGRSSWRLAAGLTVAGLAAALALAGCGSAKDSANQSSGGAPAAGVDKAEQQPPAGTGAEPAAPQAADGNNAPAKAPEKLVPDNRAIIYNGTITVRVSDVEAAADAVSTAALGANGFVSGDNRTSNGSRSEARLVLRIPSDRFGTMLTELGKLGKELSREVSTEDVTEQMVDLDARIATATESVERVRALLARATTIGEIVTLESELSRRQADLESLKARQRKLADLTTLSTVTVVLLDDDAKAPTANEPETGFLVGIKGGWKAFLSSMEVLLTVLGALLPWFVALGLPVLLLVWLLRRTAARRVPVLATPAPALATPAANVSATTTPAEPKDASPAP